MKKAKRRYTISKLDCSRLELLSRLSFLENLRVSQLAGLLSHAREKCFIQLLFIEQ